MVNDFFIFPPELFLVSFSERLAESNKILRSWFKDENRSPFLVVSWRGDIVAVQLGRPEGSPCARPGRDFSCHVVVVRIHLLIRENISDIETAAARNVNAFAYGIKIDAIH